MLANYFKVALRTLLKHKGYAFINVVGLAVGMAAGLLIFLSVRHDLAFDRFHTNADRLVHREELVSLIEEILRGRPTAEWIEVLAAVDVPCGRIRSVPEALDSPEAQARGMIVEVEGADGKPLSLLGPAVRLSASPAGIRRRPPKLGEHTGEVLREVGYSSSEIRHLGERGII